jgi:hypothetical protein
MFLQQSVVGQNATGYRIFDGHHTTGRFFASYGVLGYLPERIAGNDLYLLAKKATGRFLVETAFVSLNCYTLCTLMSAVGFHVGGLKEKTRPLLRTGLVFSFSFCCVDQ